MSFINRFIIEEDAQSECYGVVYLSKEFEVKKEVEKEGHSMTDLLSSLVSNFLEKIFKSQSDKTTLHIVLSIEYGLVDRLDRIINSIWTTSSEIMITRLKSERLVCVQKEEFERFHREGGRIKSIDGTFIYEELVNKTIGDDIEDFYNRIQLNEIYLKNKELVHSNLIAALWSLWEYRLGRFHLSLLTEQRVRRMFHQGTEFVDGEYYGNFDYFKHETILLKNDQNFALSCCSRKSFYLTNVNLENYHAIPLDHILRPYKRPRSQIPHLYEIVEDDDDREKHNVEILLMEFDTEESTLPSDPMLFRSTIDLS